MNWQAFGHLQTEIYYAHDLTTAQPKTNYNLQDSGVHFNVSFFAF
ncbi:MAG: hypothetical protein ACRERV_04800 [Methylococcales bacterium]